jgi:hypothetical protein
LRYQGIKKLGKSICKALLCSGFEYCSDFQAVILFFWPNLAEIFNVQIQENNPIID